MSLKDTCVSAWEAISVSMAANQSITDLINLGGLRLFGIALPSAWTEADLTFQISSDAGQSWSDLYSMNGDEIVGVAAASRYLSLDPLPLAPIQYLRIRSGTSVAPIVQEAARSLKLFVRSF